MKIFQQNALIVFLLFYFIASLGAQSSDCFHEKINGLTSTAVREMRESQPRSLCCDTPMGFHVIPVAAHVIKQPGESQDYPGDQLLEDMIDETNLLLAPHFELRLIDNFYNCGSGSKVFRPSEEHKTITLANEKEIKNLSRVDPEKVLNIWFVADLEPFPNFIAQGWAYSPIPNPTFPDPLDPLLDGLVIKKTLTFGETAEVIAHEFGHYLSLHHVWGPIDETAPNTPPQGNCQVSDCVSGDEIADTEACRGPLPNTSFPIINANCTFNSGHIAALTTAGLPSPFCGTSGTYPCRNIMGTAPVRDQFTNGQFCRMIEALDIYRSSLGSSEYSSCLTTPFVNFPTSFENGIGAWFQENDDDFDWTSNSGSTPSSMTGPSGAFDGNRYMYTEASGNTKSAAILLSPFFTPSGNSLERLSFAYHMYGESMGTLDVGISTDLGESFYNLWSREGNLGNQWHKAVIDLNDYVGQAVQLRITGTTGTGYRSDIAIDDIDLSGPCTITPSTILVVLPQEGGSETIGVSAAGNWNANIPASADWASLVNVTNSNFTVSAVPNTSTVSRFTSVSLNCGPTLVSVSVVQPGIQVTNDPCGPGVANIPNNLNFESTYLNGWTQDPNDDFDWTRKFGSTTSSGTGPTSAAEGSYYMYTEATNNFNKTANLVSPCLDLSQVPSPKITFSYHMKATFAAHMGTLKLQVSQNGGNTWSTLWSKTGHQGLSWILDEEVPLNNYNNNIQLRFNATTGSGFMSDIAIDDVQIRSGECYDPYEDNNSFQTAYSNFISGNITYTDPCLSAGDYDYYNYVHNPPGSINNFFVLVKGKNNTVAGDYELSVNMVGYRLYIETHPSNGSTTDTEIFLYNTNGSLIAQNDNGGQGNFSKIYTGVPTSPSDNQEAKIAASSFELKNYPNPFNQTTTFDFYLEKENNVSLVITDINGKVIARPIDDISYNTGIHKLEFDASNLAVGVYNYSLITVDGIETKQMIIVR